MTFICLGASAQSLSLGTFHAIKGLGLHLTTQDADSLEFNTYLVYADMAGVVNGTYSTPGIKACYIHDFTLMLFPGDGSITHLMAGPGMSLGWVRDRDSANYGLSCSLCANICCKIMFDKRVDIAVGFMPEIGLFARYDNSGAATTVSMYYNGLRYAVFPYVSVAWRLR